MEHSHNTTHRVNGDRAARVNRREKHTTDIQRSFRCENNIGNSRKSLFPGKQLPYSLSIVATSFLPDKRMIGLAESARRGVRPRRNFGGQWQSGRSGAAERAAERTRSLHP
jgi:hypothetical protein